MNLKTFDKTVKRDLTGRFSEPSVTVNARGKFTFSQGARRLFGLKEGDRVKLHQDKEARSWWYIEITRREEGYKIVMSETDSRFSSAAAAEELFKSIGRQPFKMRFPIMQKPFKLDDKFLYQIDLKNPLI